MASRGAVCLFTVFFLHLCSWVPCSSISRAPQRVSNALKLSTDESPVQQWWNGVGGHSSVDRVRAKRDADSTPLPDYKIRPLGDVQGVAEVHSSISPLWVKGNVLLVLTQDDERTKSSHLYRISRDANAAYSSTNISHLIGSSWSAAESMKLSAADDSVIFIVSMDQQTLLVSRDAGVSWEKQALPSSSFELAYDLLFSPVRASDMVLYDNSAREFYFSKTFGKRWTKLATGVEQMDWDGDDSAKTLNYIFYTLDDSSHNAYSHTFHRVDAQFKTSTKTDVHVYRMVVDGRFVFTSKQNFSDTKNSTRRLYSSRDHGRTFQQAHIPAVSPAQSYVLLTTHEAGAFIQYKNSGAYKGTLYVSDSGGTFFSLSLANHFYNSVQHYHDFYEVKSVRGVYITSVMVNNGLLESRITFDNGGMWQNLRSSWEPSGCESPCQLNLHLHSSVIGHGQREVLMQGPLSHTTAPGLIVATGMFQSIPSASPSAIDVGMTSNGTYLVVSSDGGETWTVPKDFQETPGYFLFGIFDYGNAIAVIESLRKQPKMWFSNDRGGSFLMKQVTSEPFIVRGFLPVPEAGDLIAAAFGQSNTSSPMWKVLFLDLTPFLQRACGKTDYTFWTPKRNCILGQNITYNIAKANSSCYNPNTYSYSSVKVANCDCSYKVDFECVYGYERGNDGTCVQSKSINSSLLRRHLCPAGQDSYNKSVKGYRRVPGDMCVGGDEALLSTTKESCVGHEAESGFGYTNVGLAVASVLVVLVLVAGLAAVILAVYWCRRRSRSNERVQYTRLPTTEPEGTDDKEGQGEEKEEQKGALDRDEDMLNPVV